MQPAEALGVAEQLQPAPQDAAGQCLALVRVAGQALAGAVDTHPKVDLLVRVADEAGAELLVQLCGDGFRQGPAQHGQVEHLSRQKSRRGGGHVVGVTGHPCGVEDQQPVSATGGGRCDHFGGQHPGRQVA